MRWTLAAVCVLAGLAGCGDRLSQGQRVILADPTADTVHVERMGPHTSPNPGMAAIDRLVGKDATSEVVPSGTRATVVLDARETETENRAVKIMLADPPLAGMTGEVRRDHIKSDR